MTEIKTEAFDKAYRRLNPEQKEAVDRVEGPVMVIAGPGTGKTEVLTLRIANIILKTGIPPEAILAITFTESGVHSMKKRLAEITGPMAYRVNLSTFHGFANSIIQDYPEYFPEIIGGVGITEIEQIKILREIIDGTDLKNLKTKNNPYYYLDKIKKVIDDLKRENVDPENFQRIIAEEKMIFESDPEMKNSEGKTKTKYLDAEKQIKKNSDLSVIYAKYEKNLRKERYYDYNDMIMKTAEALEKNSELLSILQEKYQYLLVDEHQDTNQAQNKILELLSSFYDNPNLFVVGDVKQAIFRFQGASLENFLYFKERYRGVKLIKLISNYRSTQTILDAAYDLAERDEKLEAKSSRRESPVKICEFEDRDEENYFIAKKTEELIKDGEKPEDIAVIFRENKDAHPIAEMMDKIGILSSIESDENALNDPDIMRLKKILEAVKNLGDEEKLFDALHSSFIDIPPLDIYKLSVFINEEKKKGGRLNAYDVIKSETLMDSAQIGKKEVFLKFYDDLSHWSSSSKKDDALEVLSDIIRESGFLEKILVSPEGQIKLEKLHALFNHLRSLIQIHRGYNLENFIEYLDLIEEHGLKIKTSAETAIPGRVRLMTAHRAKGLEFNEVFIVNAVEGKWSSKRKPEQIKLPAKIFKLDAEIKNDLNSRKQEEELNVFYVALTRAKKEVFITYAKTKENGESELPAEFIGKISPELTQSIDSQKYREEFKSNIGILWSKNPNKNPPLEEKQYLNELFKKQSFSVTSLNNYLKCPWQYFYRNLVRIPEAPEPSAMYGNAVHFALRNYFEYIRRGEKENLEYLVQKFETGLLREPLKENDYRNLLERGTKSLSGYYKKYSGTWNKDVILEKSINDVEINGVNLTGKLDKIEIIDGTRKVNVVDYKTGTVKSENEIRGLTKSSDGNYLRQLTFYKLLLDRHAGEKFNMVSGTIDFIEPNESGAYKKYSFEITKEDTEKLADKIKEVSEEIMNLDFWDKTCGDKKCQYCALREKI